MAMLRPDPASPTGFRLALQDAMLPFAATSEAERAGVLERFNAADGFSIATPMLALFPEAAVERDSLPAADDPGASVLADSAVQVIDRETGERVPVWAELDNRATRPTERGEPIIYDHPRRTLIIRPQTALGWGRRYAVVVTDAALDVHGAPLPRPEPFSALLRGAPTGVAALDARAADFATLLEFLAARDLPRERLVLAWEFVTMSRDFAQAPVRAMVEAIAELPADEPVVHRVTCHAADPADRERLSCDPSEELHPGVWRRLEGTFSVPSFLDAEQRIHWVQGRPQVQAGSLDVPFVVVLPPSVADAPSGSVGLLQVGHGFMSQVWRYLMRDADENGTVGMLDHLGLIGAGCDWLGLSTADLLELLDMIEHFDRLFRLQDRLLQGLVAQHLLLRFVRTTLAEHGALAASDGASLLDPQRVSYFGVSMGAILGGPYVLTSPDIDTAVLHVPSAQFSSMFQHSSEFADFQLIVDVFHPHRPRQQGVFALAQMAFDPLEPLSWHDHFVREPLGPEGPPNLLWQVSRGDSNAPDFGFYALQRAAGLPLVQPSTHTVWGVQAAVAAPTEPDTQGVVIYDTDKVPPSLDNAEVEDNGAHHALRCSPEVYAQVADYLEPGAQGTIRLHCGGGPCFIEGIDCRTRLGGEQGAAPRP